LPLRRRFGIKLKHVTKLSQLALGVAEQQVAENTTYEQLVDCICRRMAAPTIVMEAASLKNKLYKCGINFYMENHDVNI
jgi:hypothetical protein